MPLPIKDIALKATLLLLLFQLGDFAIFSVLKRGMDHYYGMDEPAKILCIGHSHTVLGVDAERLESALGVPVAKYAMAGANTLDRFWMLRHFTEEHPTVKAVIYDVDPRLFDSDGLSSASYTLFLPYIGNNAMAEYIRQETTWQEYYTSKFVKTARFRDQTINIALRGLTGKIENKKETVIRIKDYTNYLERESKRPIKIDPDSLQCFQDSITYLTQKGIQVFLTFIPMINLLNNIDPARQAQVVDIFEKASANNANVYFLNYNQEHQHNHELFYDLRHLNKIGNELVTNQLTNDLRLYLK